MRFHLNAEQTAIQDAVRRTLADQWPIQRLHSFADDVRDVDAPSWQALMELGAASLLLPESAGGAGMTLVDAALLCEEAGRAAASGPLIAQIVASLALSWSDGAAQRDLLADVSQGRIIVSLLQDGGQAQAAQSASYFMTLNDGVILYPAASMEGIGQGLSTDRSRPIGKAAWREDSAVRLFSADDSRTGRLRDAALILIAADALGVAEYCTDLSVAYAKERQQFGQPIGRFQGLKHQLAHMALDVEPARAMLWYAAYCWDQKLDETSRSAMLTKAHLADVSVRAARAAIAAHGGIGYTWEYGLNYWFRRSLINNNWMGSSARLRQNAADLAGW